MTNEPKQKITSKLEHPSFPQPENYNSKVWRYMDISKLVDIIRRKKLFLSRLDLLGDPHEGSITKVDYEHRKKIYEKHGLSRTSAEIESNMRITKCTYVNCWYMDEEESEAMWKLFCSDNMGIAIQSSYQQLVDSVEGDENTYIGKVTYINYETEWFPGDNLYYRVMHKRKAYMHEKEVRLVNINLKNWADDNAELPKGIYCPWDILDTAENIYINPYAQDWYFEVVSDILGKYDCTAPLKWSYLRGLPYY